MSRPGRPLRVVHTGDVHLGADSSVASSGDPARRVFRLIVDHVLAVRADLLLIAGDLFDHNRVSDELVDFVRAELDRLSQPVVILPGNHDALCRSSIYDRHDFGTPRGHVRVIRERQGERIDFPELGATVWGRAMEEHVPQFQPLAGLPRRSEDRWCLAMGHGFFHERRQDPERSSPIFAEDIRDSGWDYVALGHHHVETDVSQGAVAAYYSGAPLAGWGETAAPGSVLHVELSSDHGVRVVRQPIA